MGIALLAALAALSSHPGRVAAGSVACAGDCDGNGEVSVDELITMVSIALGERELPDCKAGDRNDDGAIQVDEIISAVSRALEGCGDPNLRTYLDHPFDPYLAYSQTEGGPSWVKFTIRVDQPGIVYFQNSSLYPFHQQFVSQFLPGYLGWTAAEIDAVSLHAEGQQLVFGAVLYSPSEPREVAIQLVRPDPYSVDEVATYFESVRSAVRAVEGVPFFYFPSFEQQESAEQNREALEARDIRLGSTARWAQGDECYTYGWAHGRLVFVHADEIDAAYAAGTLRPDDILLTDGVPAEIPFVAGVLSLVPSTPSSHVAILASDWEIPFAFLAQQASAEAAQALVGRDVILRATTAAERSISSSLCEAKVVDVTGRLSESVVSHLRDLKTAPDLQIRPFVRAGSYSRAVSTATPDDVVTVGGKAANYGFLLREIPDNARPAIAFTFDLWSDYLDQPIEGGGTLRERIATLLAPFPSYPPSDFGALFDALDQVRDLIDDSADFTETQRSAIVTALQPFNPQQPIRFRSSTNVEDGDVFTGAGLYESESGCLADDLDDDKAGPSRCDATRTSERGVFRALRKVYKSFYNDNAFLERLRHRVDESTVGMAVLVNHTFVDASELANGVATLHVYGPNSSFATIVSQPGAFSVTNPEDAGLPEVVDVYISSFSGTFPTLRQSTDRLPLGATVLTMPDEYDELTALIRMVGVAFGAFHHETTFDIEFEYKKVVGEGLEVKQVRRLPHLATTPTAPVLIDTGASLCTFQGEYSDLLANYRLKTRWQPRFVDGPVGSGRLQAAADHSFVLDGRVQSLSGDPAGWPGASHETFSPDLPDYLGFHDSWSVGTGASQRTMTLTTLVPEAIGPNDLPIVFPEDLTLYLEAKYASPVPYREYDGSVLTRSEEVVRLSACGDVGPLAEGNLLKSRSYSKDGIAAVIGFYWPPVPGGAVAGYTAPLVRWTQTSITGIGSQETVLQGFFSQTYRPEHHNFAEGFAFDPHLEAGIDPEVLGAWDAAGIQALFLPAGFGDAPPLVLTLDGDLRPIAEGN